LVEREKETETERERERERDRSSMDRGRERENGAAARCILQRHVGKDPLPSTRSHILSFHHLQITHQIYEPSMN
jgi:hypothetical protein